MDTALAKLERMLVAIDTNTSFVTNKTASGNILKSHERSKQDDVLNELGIVLLKKGDRAAALARWQEAVSSTQHFRALLNLGQALYKGSQDGSNERTEATRVLNRLLKLKGVPATQTSRQEEACGRSCIL